MSTAPLKALCKNLPKAELHIHIEGSLQPDLLFSLAKKNDVQIPYSSLEEVQAAYDFDSLDAFLKLYYQGMSVLIKREDFEELAWAYGKRASEDGVVYAEPFFDPQGHISRGIPLRTVYEGLRAGFDRAERDFGIRCNLIFSFLRHLPEEESLSLVRPDPANEDATYARELFARGAFVAIGLDSSEKPFPPENFTRLFAYCRDELKVPHCVAHAGEEGPAAYVRTALDALRVDRIDHGVACRTDAALRKELRERRMPLTVCPYSNVDLCVFPNKAECARSVLDLLREGLCVTLNSDDPAYFGNGAYMAAQFEMLVEECPDVKPEELKQFALNSFEASFISEEQKEAYRTAVEAAYAKTMGTS